MIKKIHLILILVFFILFFNNVFADTICSIIQPASITSYVNINRFVLEYNVDTDYISEIKLNDFDYVSISLSDTGYFKGNIPLYESDTNILIIKTIFISDSSVEFYDTRYIVYDPYAPKVYILTPSENTILTSDSSVLISGTVPIENEKYRPDYLLINSDTVEYSDTGYFYKRVVLNEGINEFIVYSCDKAGNSTPKPINITKILLNLI